MNFTITKVQLFLMLFFRTTGITFIAYSEVIIHTGGRDTWIMFLISAVIVFIQLCLYEKFYKYFKLGKLTQWIFIIFWILLLICSFVYMQYTLSIWVEQKTPNSITLLIMLFISFYISVSRPSTAVNMPVFLIPFVFIFVFSLLYAAPQLSFSHIFPIGTSTEQQWIKGTLFGLASFTGLEGYLVLRKYVLTEDKIRFKDILIYQLIITLFIAFIILIVEMFFAKASLPYLTEPVLYILKSLEVTFVKRLDIFFLYMWLAWSIISCSLIIFNIRIVYFQKERKHPKLAMAVLHILLFIGSIGFLNIRSVEFVRDNFQYLYIPITVLLPLVVIWKNKRRDTKCIK
ncbi:spore germination protein [Rummeliibacillus stabekisii]|uniref:GerAB/ArcD/ProY family transporter n=1 Tax=Rummeliibacillus stabekisii TaxID=241244 RepID=UPI00204079AC|nr:GerAB/ArcD/ProY family transporter [Rummeliibacillus stabekisii]MCM3316166.1 spore germination protein [Rummeliibacillus stabekisii]